MELGDQNVVGLALCSSSSYDDEQVRHTAQSAMSALLGAKRAEDSMQESSISDFQHQQQMFAALSCTFLEAAKSDISSEELRSLFEREHQMSGRRTQMLGDIYLSHKNALRSLLAKTSAASPIPSLVATDWRMDLDVAHSLDRNMAKKPLFHFTLTTQAAGSVAHDRLQPAVCPPPASELRMVMTEEQLQDLAMRLREACRAAEASHA
mmetsp:Transcript_2306/g.4662  ORF Transcript_2306/g.4662 Transcript_2306/m.4662 type:complete len:208 (-) Transcript_2306:176-799(-)|eukprot:CAMPEP_0118923588 /NCGR_PEP_ID=MMETSP1169-20130426/2059_1 /TAXON_ID=36882 /ORGANISM="Pyramimonas obovata, Strain CCMP722" /LENGTH=207 /DNA_ID=CAMNT_0006864601 /DNA_START=335 /DNA_END=958 /DNA_ORIENTATION=+